jgi:hypothetical protein
MTVIPFAPGACRLIHRRANERAGRRADIVDLIDLAERARLKGNLEQADRLLLAAWANYDGQGQADRVTAA